MTKIHVLFSYDMRYCLITRVTGAQHVLSFSVRVIVLQPVLLVRNVCYSRTRLPSPPIATVAPRCLLGLTFPYFDLAPKRKVWLLRT